MPTQIIHAENKKQWLAALQSCGAYDTYNLPGYCRVCLRFKKGEPYLFFFSDGNHSASIPLLIRPIAEIPGLEDSKGTDAVSPYGYPGIVSSILDRDDDAEQFSYSFQAAFISELRRLHVRSVFIRFNPLFMTEWLIEGIADLVELGPTVVIDLLNTNIDEVKGMTHHYRSSLKQRINKAKKKGVICKIDNEFKYLNEFIAIYNETMARVNASSNYFFPAEYYYDLKENLGNNLKLFTATLNGRVISGALFFLCKGIIQYHLSGTRNDALKNCSMHLMLETVHRWGVERGYRWFHLGGGVGSRRDKLFQFKAGFTKLKTSFRTYRIGKIILDRQQYDHLTKIRNHWACQQNHTICDDTFFPAYRAPLK